MNGRKNALVILTPGFPKDETDGNCLPERQSLVKALKELYPGLQIIVLAFHYPYVPLTYCWHGVEVTAFNGRNKAKMYRLMVCVKVWRQLMKINRQYKIIGLQSFWMNECALVGQLFARRYGLLHYCWLLGQDAKGGNKYVSLVKPKPSELIALSDFIAGEFFRNYGIRPEHIIPVGLDTRLFGTQQQPERTIDIMGAGSLIPLKQYDVFVHAVYSLAKHFPGIKVVLCGWGREKERLIKLANDLNVQENICLTGEIPHREVLQKMQQSKIFLHTSSYEGFGAVMLEALYAGAHVVSFCQPLKREIEQWHIVRSQEELVQKALQLLSDNKREHKRILPFGIHDVARQTMKLFDE